MAVPNHVHSDKTGDLSGQGSRSTGGYDRSEDKIGSADQDEVSEAGSPAGSASKRTTSLMDATVIRRQLHRMEQLSGSVSFYCSVLSCLIGFIWHAISARNVVPKQSPSAEHF